MNSLTTSLILFVFICFLQASFAEKLEKCPEKCDPKICSKPRNCKTGIVKDRCNCCDICGLEEGQVCNLSEEEMSNKDMVAKAEALRAEEDFEWQGYCGIDLSCKPRFDVQLAADGKRFITTHTNITVCQCEKQLDVCATDGKTYTWCQLNQAIAESKDKLEMKFAWPCPQKATITEVINNSKHVRGGKVLYGCKAEGSPKPIIKWKFVNSRDIGKKKYIDLPGYLSEISVTTRPNMKSKRVFISYLQIKDYSVDHEGIYVCEARNDLGSDQSQFTSVMN